MEVVGVVEDFHTNTLIMDIDPIVLTYEPARFRVANIRVRSGSMPGVLAHLRQTWTQIGSAHDLDYERYTVQIEQEPMMMLYQDLMYIVGLISGFAVLIACLGLFGMATYTAETRVKEVGVRKVLGASVSEIVLSKDFLKRIFDFFQRKGYLMERWYFTPYSLLACLCLFSISPSTENNIRLMSSRIPRCCGYYESM